MARVVSVGSISVDLVLELEAPLPGTVQASSRRLVPGGKGANVAVGVARLGLDAVLVGHVGDDEHGRIALRGPAEAGVDVTGVAAVGTSTGFSVVLVEPGGGTSIAREPGANVWSTARSWTGPDPVVVVVDAEISRELVEATIAAARRCGATLVVDPAPAAEISEAMIAAADVLTPDHHEAATLTGIDVEEPADGLRAARLLHERGARLVAVKLPEGGATFASAEGDGIVSAPPVHVVDTNGAGDAFAAAVAWAIAAGRRDVEVVVAGVAASACAAAGRTAQGSAPNELALRRAVAATSWRPA